MLPFTVIPFNSVKPLHGDVVRVDDMESTTVSGDHWMMSWRCMVTWCGWMIWRVLPLTASSAMA